MFTRLIHSDWSMHPGKRWMASASRIGGSWYVDALQKVCDLALFLDDLFGGAETGAVLAGFDFPIGLPAAYGARTGFTGFPEALAAFGHGMWNDFFTVSHKPADILFERPFYPAGSGKGTLRMDLVNALGFASFDDLRRECERATDTRRAASPLFWTLGGNQVGKGALTGWQEILRPAMARGARLWPFDGPLMSLGASGGVVLAETYPGEAYSHVGVRFRPGQSKTRQSDRAGFADAILELAGGRGVECDDAVQDAIRDGFGSGKSGEDRFDALIGLLSMIEVVTGGRSEGWASAGIGSKWEGWILGMEQKLSHSMAPTG
jgi:hypothetical protein